MPRLRLSLPAVPGQGVSRETAGGGLMAVRAGKLNKRVALQEPSRVADGRGGYTTTWSTVATVWAQVHPLSPDERVAAAQMQAQLTHRVTIRYRDGITAAMRVLYGTRALSIVGPPRDVDERHELLFLSCNEET
ncbi:MAG: phage head closure protein [Arhodomonas sp.]|nr:phage head closure protein [Arhodomonas sp.]